MFLKSLYIFSCADKFTICIVFRGMRKEHPRFEEEIVVTG